MAARTIVPTILILLALLVDGCAGSPTSGAISRTEQTQPSRGTPKQIQAAIMGDPPTLAAKINSAGGAGVPGTTPVDSLVNAGLTIADDSGRLQPQLAQQVPTTDNGLWKLYPDGQMETTWHLRPGIQWHDGEPFTAEDLVFTSKVQADKTITVFGDIAYESIASVEAPDPGTVVVRWTKPFIDADAMFPAEFVMPKHLLERVYQEDKANLINAPYWSQQFVGTGPYRLERWERGSYLMLRANQQFVLGQPKIDEIKIWTIPDSNALSANILAGNVDIVLDRNMALEQALELGPRWSDGKIYTPPSSFLMMYPQFISPSPAAIRDVQFRRALVYALDRQGMADSLVGPGLSSVSDVFLDPKEPQYPAIQQAIVKYSYDPRRAAQMIEELGFRKGGDGSYRDQSGDPLAIEIRNRGIEVGQRATFAAADDWSRLGLPSTPVIVPAQRGQDREYMSTFPGFLLYNQPSDITFLKRLPSSQTPLPDNAYVGLNYSRYMDPEFDAAIERVFSTIPVDKRMEALGAVVRQMTDQMLIVGLFYNVIPMMISNRLQNVPADPGRAVWNAYQWDVR